MCFKLKKRKIVNELNIPLGKNEKGKKEFLDLNKARHVLIAGKTGSGKSNFLHNAINYLTKNYSKEEVRLFLIDQKQTEFTKYQNLPHIKPWAVKDYGDIIFGLYWVIEEIEIRKENFEKENVFNIEKYNQKTGKNLPHIVVIIDEGAELIRPNTECGSVLQWIASFDNAFGVHLILATQMISPDVLEPVLKVNLQTRICFPVAERVDSLHIVHKVGAEKLMTGDFLYKSPSSDKVRKLKSKKF